MVRGELFDNMKIYMVYSDLSRESKQSFFFKKKNQFAINNLTPWYMYGLNPRLKGI